jgi:succinoglycan biosynthesis transport protein ExoP
MWNRIDKTKIGSLRMLPTAPEMARRGVAGAARLSRLAGRTLGRILWRRRWLVLACLVVVLGLTTLRIATLTPMFEAATLVAVGGPADSEPPPGRGASSEQPGLAEEVRLISSRATADRLIDRLDLQLSAEFNPEQRSGSGAAGSLALLPPAVLDALAARDAAPTDEERAARLHEQIVGAVLPRIRVEPADPAVLSLGFVAADPDLAAAGATALAELYLESRRHARPQERERERQRLGQEIERLAATLGATEKAIEELRSRSGSERASEQDLLNLTGELAFWRGERAELEARLPQAGGALEADASLDQAAKSLDPAQLGELTPREVALERELAKLSQAPGGQDPQISSLRTELIALDDQKRLKVEQSIGQLEQETAIIRSREAALEGRIEALRTRLAESEAAGGLEALERKAEADRELLRSSMDRAERLASAPQAGEPDARILAPAVTPKEPKYPRRALIYAVAFGGALLLGSLLALGMEAWERARA